MLLHKDSATHAIGYPIPHSKMTKIQGPTVRHLEQLWDEIKKLKERVAKLEKKH